MMKAGQLVADEASKVILPPKRTRGLAVFDLVLRLLALAGTLGSAVGMGQAEEVLPFSTQFFRFDAQYGDFGEFQLFIIVNSIVCGYLALSLPVSIYHVVRRRASGKSRILLVFLDTIIVLRYHVKLIGNIAYMANTWMTSNLETILALLTAGASAAAAMVYLAHNGNSAANWFSVCQQYMNFCQSVSGSLIGSFLAMVGFVFLIILSSVSLSRNQ